MEIIGSNTLFRATHAHVVCYIIGHIHLFINQGTMAKHANTEFSRLNLVINICHGILWI